MYGIYVLTQPASLLRCHAFGAPVSSARLTPRPREAAQRPLCSSSLLTLYKSAPDTAKIALRTGVYITAFGAALLAAPLKIMSLLQVHRRVTLSGFIHLVLPIEKFMSLSDS